MSDPLNSSEIEAIVKRLEELEGEGYSPIQIAEILRRENPGYVRGNEIPADAYSGVEDDLAMKG